MWPSCSSFCLVRDRVIEAACPFQPMSGRVGEGFLNQEKQSVYNRRKRQLMARGRSKSTVLPVLKRPAALKKPSAKVIVQSGGSRHKRYPCCGHRRSRCKCDWSVVKARLNSAAWQGFLRTLSTAELRYVTGSVARR